MLKNGLIKKADIVLGVALLIIGFASLLLLRSPAAEDAIVEITVDGKTFGSYSLSVDKEIEINSDYGYNHVVIKDGEVWVDDADCHGKDCMSFGHIKNTGEIIACAPHRVLITITGGDGVDFGAY